jgi:hypothetical protein
MPVYLETDGATTNTKASKRTSQNTSTSGLCFRGLRSVVDFVAADIHGPVTSLPCERCTVARDLTM